MEKTLLEYGVVGAILLYFLWKDSRPVGSNAKGPDRIKKRCGGD